MKIFFMLLFVSCASHYPGKKIEVYKNAIEGLNASLDKHEGMSDDHYSFYTLTVGNESSKRLDFKEIEVVDLPEGVKILSGEVLSQWIEHVKHNSEVSAHNTNLLLGTIALTGTALALGSKSSTTQTIGAVGAIGAMGVDTIRSLKQTLNGIHQAQMYPQNHLYNLKSIYPYLKFKRWFVLYSETGKFSSQYKLKLTTTDNKNHEYIMRLKQKRKNYKG